MNLDSALSDIFHRAFASNILCRGLKESVKSLERQTAVLCVGADDTEERAIISLIHSLCINNSVPFIPFPSKHRLGEISGLCRVDDYGNPRKVVPTSVVIVKDHIIDCEGWEYIKCNVLPTNDNVIRNAH